MQSCLSHKRNPLPQNAATLISGITTLVVTTFMLVQVTSKHVYAAQDKQFLTEYNTTYEITPSGDTVVTQNIVMTNLKNDVVATSYSQTLKQIRVFDAKAEVNGKVVEPRKDENDGDTTLNLAIPGSAIGEGRQNKITLTYKTKNIQNKVGEVWNVNIPKAQIAQGVEQYNVTLKIPNDIGPKIFISPKVNSEQRENASINYIFTKEDLSGKSISASFGKYQVINFKLTYQIKNQFIFGSKTLLTLPADIAHQQQVSYTSIDPKPESMTQDKDGNVIAQFNLKPKQRLDIVVKGSAKIMGRQIDPALGGKLENIPKDLNVYLKDTQYWEVKNTKVKQVAKTLFDPKLNTVQNAQKIYDYVVTSLDYNYNAIKQNDLKRQGAFVSLNEKGTWTCMEFTDTFIALARASGIPAREINGYAFTVDQQTHPLSVSIETGDVLHAWPQFYDPNYGWIMVDPTWGKTSGVDYFTKLDTNHFAFVTKGISSTQPLPAGAFRLNDSDKLIDVDFSAASSKDAFKESLEVKKVTGLNIFQIIKGNSKYEIRNTGNVYIYNIGGSGKNIAPGMSVSLYLPKTADKVTYQTLIGETMIKYF